MEKHQKVLLTLLRVSVGWLFLYAGLSKITAGDWSAAGYLTNAQTFPGLFAWLASPGILPITNFVNEWGQVLIGLSLIFGLLVRYSGVAGAIMMLLYYLPILDFPYPNEHSFIVDEHVIYALVLLYLSAAGAGKYWGLENRFLRWKKK